MGRRALALLVTVLAAVAVTTTSASAESASASLHGRVTVHTVDGDGKKVPKGDASDVVVYLTGFNRPPPERTEKIIQKDKRFLPAVLPIVVGQTVEFPNEDVRIHNVFSKSRARSFDLGKYRKGDTPKSVVFEKTGIVEVYCDIHEEMAASVLVLPNDAFAVTAKDGRFVVKNVPPGKYTAFAWHRRGEPMKKEIELAAGQALELSFELVETRTQEPHLNKYGQPYKKRGDGY